jgi:EmrB/QacA subfamily drug resistance transporter
MLVGQSNPQSGASKPASRAVFLVIAAAVFVSNLDLFIVNVALPAMGRGFHGTSLASLSWVLNGYAIVFAALLVVAGRMADRTSHRTVFLLGLATFTVASVLCALSPNVGWLVAARVVQAAGAALLMPTSLALLITVTEPAKRPQAVRAWAAIGGIAAGLGPVVGGLLVEADWRWVFLVNVPVGVAALIAGLRILPDARTGETGPLPDLLGAGVLTAAIAALAVGLVKADDWGWGSARVIGSLAASVVLAAVFVRRSATHQAPIVELPLLRVRTFAAAALAALLFTIAFSGMLLSAVLWCQQVWGYSALRTGLAIAPGPLMVPLLSIGAAPLVRRLGAGRLAAVGSMVFAVGVIWWAVFAKLQGNYASGLLPGMILTGIGVGLTVPTLVGAAVTSLPPQRFATGSAIATMARQIGAVLGVAALVSILGTPTGGTALTSFRHAWAAVAAAAALAGLAALTLRRPQPTTSVPSQAESVTARAAGR